LLLGVRSQFPHSAAVGDFLAFRSLVLKAAGGGGFLMLLAFDKKNNGFKSIKNVLTRQGRCYTFKLLNGETLATISFEELCAGGLSGGGESFRLLPG